jgi:hypothetical protein
LQLIFFYVRILTMNGITLKGWLKIQGVSVRRFARWVGVSPATISRAQNKIGPIEGPLGRAITQSMDEMELNEKRIKETDQRKRVER